MGVDWGLNFLSSQNEDGQAHCDVVPVEVADVARGELRHHFFVMHYRTGNQVREVGNEQNVTNEVEPLHFAVIRIHPNGDLGEGKE